MTNKIEEINKNEINAQKIKFLDIQLLATIGFILALIISFLLSYDKELSLKNEKRLFDEKTAQNLALFQTILVFVISACFLYTNFNQYNLAKKVHDSDEQDLFLQIETSIFGIISAIIGLYIIFKNYRKRNLAIAETEIF